MKTNQEQIKNAGIRFAHFRNIDGRGNVNPIGGMTAAYKIEVPPDSNEAVMSYALAHCRGSEGHSQKHDNFSRKIGAAISAGRLLSGDAEKMVITIDSAGDWSAAKRWLTDFLVKEHATPAGLSIKARKRAAKKTA